MDQRNSQPNPNVNITSGDTRRSKENMSTVATWTGDLHGILSAMGRGAIEGYCSALFIKLAYCRLLFEMESMRTKNSHES